MKTLILTGVSLLALGASPLLAQGQSGPQKNSSPAPLTYPAVNPSDVGNGPTSATIKNDSGGQSGQSAAQSSGTATPAGPPSGSGGSQAAGQSAAQNGGAATPSGSSTTANAAPGESGGSGESQQAGANTQWNPAWEGRRMPLRGDRWGGRRSDEQWAGAGNRGEAQGEWSDTPFSAYDNTARRYADHNNHGGNVSENDDLACGHGQAGAMAGKHFSANHGNGEQNEQDWADENEQSNYGNEASGDQDWNGGNQAENSNGGNGQDWGDETGQPGQGDEGFSGENDNGENQAAENGNGANGAAGQDAQRDRHTEVRLAHKAADAARKVMPEARFETYEFLTNNSQRLVRVGGVEADTGRPVEIDVTPGGEVRSVARAVPLRSVPYRVREAVDSRLNDFRPVYALRGLRSSFRPFYRIEGYSGAGQPVTVGVAADGGKVTVHRLDQG